MRGLMSTDCDLTIDPHDYQQFRPNEERLASIEARRQALDGEGESFDSVDALMADLDA